jgi:hypothetical protein
LYKDRNIGDEVDLSLTIFEEFYHHRVDFELFFANPDGPFTLGTGNQGFGLLPQSDGHGQQRQEN